MKPRGDEAEGYIYAYAWNVRRHGERSETMASGACLGEELI